MKTVTSYLSTIIAILLYLPSCACKLDKVSFTSTATKITAIQSCKTFNSVLYTTEDGWIHQWLGFAKTNDYAVGGTSHQISCSRYGADAEHTYVGVLDGEGRVKILQETYSRFTPINSNMEFINFVIMRAGPVSDLSIGQNYVAIGYKNISTIDIYAIDPSTPTQPLSIKMPSAWNTIKMDTLDNLAVATSVNSSIIFQYYLKPYIANPPYLSLAINESVGNSSITMDYKYQADNPQDPNSNKILSYLVMANNGSTYIHYHPDGIGLVSEITNKKTNRLCNNQQTYIEQNAIRSEDSEIYVDDINQHIIDYACISEGQSYVEYMYYILSTDGQYYYVDAYDIVSGWIYWIIAGVVVLACCCGCCAGVIKNNGCRDMVQLIKFLCGWCYAMFLWCPTPQSMDTVQQSLQL